MNGLGISIGVDANRVREAKKEISFLNKALKETESFNDLAPGHDGLDETSALLKRVTEDIRQLKGLSVSGEKQGGLLKKEQFQEAAMLSKKIGENFGVYTKEVSKARAELVKLLSEKAKLENISRQKESGSGKYESLAEFEKRQKRLADLEEDIASKRTVYNRFKKQEGAARDLKEKGLGYTEAIGGYGEMPGQAGSSFSAGRLLRRIGGYGLAFAGGFSLMHFLRESMDKEKMFSESEADLYMRGGRQLRRASYGFNPMESAEMADTLSRRTGFAGSELNSLNESNKRFSRGMGISSDITMGYVGGIYQATGLKVKEYREVLGAIRDSVTGLGARGRTEDFLRSNQQLIASISQSMSGKELSKQDVNRVLALQTGLWMQPGMMGKGGAGAQFLMSLDQSIRSGGQTPGQQMFSFTAMGGQNVRSLTDYNDLLRRQAKGILEPDNLKNAMELAKGIGGRKTDGSLSEAGKLLLMKQYGLDILQADFLSSSYDSGLMTKKTGETEKQYFERIESQLKEKGLLRGSLETDIDKAMGRPGNVRRQIDASMDIEKLKLGEKLQPVVDKLKEGFLKFVSSIEKGEGLWSAFRKGMKNNPLGQLAVGTLVVGGALQLGSAALGGLLGGMGLAGLRKIFKRSPGEGIKVLSDALEQSGQKNIAKSLRLGGKTMGGALSMLLELIYPDELGRIDDKTSINKWTDRKKSLSQIKDNNVLLQMRNDARRPDHESEMMIIDSVLEGRGVKYNDKTQRLQRSSALNLGDKNEQLASVSISTDSARAIVDELRMLRQELKGDSPTVKVALLPAMGMKVSTS